MLNMRMRPGRVDRRVNERRECTRRPDPAAVLSVRPASDSAPLTSLLKSSSMPASSMIRGGQMAIVSPGMLMKVTLQSAPRTALIISEEDLQSRSREHFVMRIKERDGEPVAVRSTVRIGSPERVKRRL